MLQFNSLAELDEFVDRFEKAQIPQPEFSHRAHLAIAANYLALMPFDVAVGQVRQGLRNLLEAYKIDGYNETITLFWMNRALEYVREHGTGSNRLDVVNGFVAVTRPRGKRVRTGKRGL